MTGDTFDPDTVTWVMDLTHLPDLYRALDTCQEVVIDLETTGLDEHATGHQENSSVPARISMASLTLPVEGDEETLRPRTFVLPLSHPHGPLVGCWRKVLTGLAKKIRDTGRPIVNQNLKFDLRWIRAHTGVDLSSQFDWDTQLSSHLLDENQSTKLKERAPETFGVSAWDDFDLATPGASEKVPLFDLGIYAARDTYWTWRLALEHRRRLWLGGGFDVDPETPEEVEAYRLGRLARWCVMPTGATLTAIEQRGMRMDVGWVEREIQCQQRIQDDDYRWMVERYSLDTDRDPSFAPTSNWFLTWAEAAVRAGDLRVISLTEGGRPQWSKSVLTRLARVMDDKGIEDSVPRRLLSYRQAGKKIEYLTSWLQMVTPEGRIHTTYHAGKVVTGRLSSCVTADTLIDMPRDMVRYPDGVPITEVKPGDWVYSFDWKRELTLRQVEWVGQTKIAETVVVTFENSEGHRRVLRCTPDHLIRLRNGDWRAAGNLMRAPGDRETTQRRVMTMVRRGFDPDQGYLYFFPHSIARGNGMSSGGRSKEHRWVMEQVFGKRLSTKLDVHHHNGTKIDNTPSNLIDLTMSEHRALGRSHARYGESRESPEVYLGPNDYRVVSVERGEVEPVWDMTVPEDHQFVANGIVVHNSDPNMQQVTKALKPAFVPTEGYHLAELDYSQIELRAAAHVANCTSMINAFNQGQDLHRLLAARITGKDPEDVTPVERQSGKSANFGLLYGMGAEGFREYAEDVYGVSFTPEEAMRAHRAFFEQWPEMAVWHARVGERARRTGQVSSPIGRVRRVPDVWSGDNWSESRAERQAINSPVQGFASDMMQMAAASIEGRLPGYDPVPGVRLVATVHDSIILEVPQGDWKRTTATCMRRMVQLDRVLSALGCRLLVPLQVEATVGSRWGLGDVGSIVG